jgi:hypothetical protein
MTFWIDVHSQRSICVDDVGGHAESRHLVRMTRGGDIIIQVSAQHWFRDIAGFVEQFLNRLAIDKDLQGVVERNDVRITESSRATLKRQFTATDMKALGI